MTRSEIGLLTAFGAAAGTFAFLIYRGMSPEEKRVAEKKVLDTARGFLKNVKGWENLLVENITDVKHTVVDK